MSVEVFTTELLRGTWGILLFGLLCLILGYRLNKKP